MSANEPLRQLAALGLAAIATFALFAIWPGLDLWVSGLFYDPARGFATIDQGWANSLRLAIWQASEALLAAAILALIIGWITGEAPFLVSRRVWAFIVVLYLLGPGLLVDAILKPMWGRARPEDVTEFGGKLSFTPPQSFVGECARNCSFVAGEMAGAVALAVSLSAILAAWRGGLTARAQRMAELAILILPIYAGLQRIAAGRHFLSDVVFATIFVLAVAVALRAVMLTPARD